MTIPPPAPPVAPAKVAGDPAQGDTPVGVAGILATLDAMMGQIKPGQMFMISGRPGMGKSAFTQGQMSGVAQAAWERARRVREAEEQAQALDATTPAVEETAVRRL